MIIKMKHKENQGFSLITAIFLVVVVAGLGAMAVTFFSAQQQSSALDALGSRAYQAARAGIEWSTFQITQPGVAGSTFANACQSNTPVTPPSFAGTPLSQFSLAVSCTAKTSYMDGTNLLWVYSITATATGPNGAPPGSADYVERVMQVTIASGVSGDPASGIIYQRESY